MAKPNRLNAVESKIVSPIFIGVLYIVKNLKGYPYSNANPSDEVPGNI